jgi:hypothetical protein
MAVRADEREMISERIAPGMLPRVLSSLDMTIIFVAIVLFIVSTGSSASSPSSSRGHSSLRNSG